MADVNLVPLEDHVLVEPQEDDETTSPSGLILPDSGNKEKPSKGRVVAVWQGKILDSGQRGPMDVQVGDTVHFTKYSPDELKIGSGEDEKTYLVVRHSSILAVER